MFRKTFIVLAASLMTLTAFSTTVTVMTAGTAAEAHIARDGVSTFSRIFPDSAQDGRPAVA